MKNNLNVIMMTIGEQKNFRKKLDLIARISSDLRINVNVQISLNAKNKLVAENFLSSFPAESYKVNPTARYLDSAEEHLNYVYQTYGAFSLGRWLWVISDEDPFLVSNLKDFLQKLPEIGETMVFLGTRWQGDGGWFSEQSSFSSSSKPISIRDKLLHVGVPYAGSKIGSYIIYIDDGFINSLKYFDSLLKHSILFSHGYFYFYLATLRRDTSLVWHAPITGNAPNPTDVDRSAVWKEWNSRHNRPFHFDWTVGQILLLKQLYQDGKITSDEILYSTISDSQRGHLSFVWDLCWRLNNKVLPCLTREEERFPDGQLTVALDFLEEIGFNNRKLLSAWKNSLTDVEVSRKQRLADAKFAIFSWGQISSDACYFLRQDSFLDKRIIRIQNSYFAFDSTLYPETIIKYFFSMPYANNILISESILGLQSAIEENYGDQNLSLASNGTFQNIKFAPFLKFSPAQLFILKHFPFWVIRVLRVILASLRKM